MLRIIRNIIKIMRQLPVDCWRYIYGGFDLNRMLLVELNVLFYNGFGGRQRKLLILRADIIFIANKEVMIIESDVAIILNKCALKCNIISKRDFMRMYK